MSLRTITRSQKNRSLQIHLFKQIKPHKTLGDHPFSKTGNKQLVSCDNCVMPAKNFYASTAFVKSMHQKTLTFEKDDEKCLTQTGRTGFTHLKGVTRPRMQA